MNEVEREGAGMKLTRRLNAFAEGDPFADRTRCERAWEYRSSCINVEVSLDFIQRLTAKGVLEAVNDGWVPDAISQNCRLEWQWGRMTYGVVIHESNADKFWV